MNGTIKTIKHDKGYGFLRASNGSEFFCHLSNFVSKLSFQEAKEGQKVEFDVEAGPKGMRAINVVVIS